MCAEQTNDDDLAGIATTTAVVAIALSIAEGILIERYGISGDVAAALLKVRADDAGLPVVDAARWLLSTRNLP